MEDFDATTGIEFILKNRSNWNLASDASLLKYLQSVSAKIINGAQATLFELDSFDNDINDIRTEVNIINSRLLALSDSQFLESRVKEEQIEMPENPLVKEEKIEEKDTSAKLKQALDNGIQLLNTHYRVIQVAGSDSESEMEDETGEVLVKARNPYQDRKFPYLIGTEHFLNDDQVGLGNTSSEETEDEEEDEEEEENNTENGEIDKQSAKFVKTPEEPQKDGISISISESESENSASSGDQINQIMNADNQKSKNNHNLRRAGETTFADQLKERITNFSSPMLTSSTYDPSVPHLDDMFSPPPIDHKGDDVDDDTESEDSYSGKVEKDLFSNSSELSDAPSKYFAKTLWNSTSPSYYQVDSSNVGAIHETHPPELPGENPASLTADKSPTTSIESFKDERGSDIRSSAKKSISKDRSAIGNAISERKEITATENASSSDKHDSDKRQPVNKKTTAAFMDELFSKLNVDKTRTSNNTNNYENGDNNENDVDNVIFKKTVPRSSFNVRNDTRKNVISNKSDAVLNKNSSLFDESGSSSEDDLFAISKSKLLAPSSRNDYKKTSSLFGDDGKSDDLFDVVNKNNKNTDNNDKLFLFNDDKRFLSKSQENKPSLFDEENDDDASITAVKKPSSVNYDVKATEEKTDFDKEKTDIDEEKRLTKKETETVYENRSKSIKVKNDNYGKIEIDNRYSRNSYIVDNEENDHKQSNNDSKPTPSFISSKEPNNSNSNNNITDSFDSVNEKTKLSDQLAGSDNYDGHAASKHTEKIISPKRAPGKLNPNLGIHINVNALLPNAKKSYTTKKDVEPGQLQKTILTSSSDTESPTLRISSNSPEDVFTDAEIIATSETDIETKSTGKLSPPLSSEDNCKFPNGDDNFPPNIQPAILSSCTKTRAKLSSKRRPPTRRPHSTIITGDVFVTNDQLQSPTTTVSESLNTKQISSSFAAASRTSVKKRPISYQENISNSSSSSSNALNNDVNKIVPITENIENGSLLISNEKKKTSEENSTIRNDDDNIIFNSAAVASVQTEITTDVSSKKLESASRSETAVGGLFSENGNEVTVDFTTDDSKRLEPKPVRIKTDVRNIFETKSNNVQREKSSSLFNFDNLFDDDDDDIDNLFESLVVNKPKISSSERKDNDRPKESILDDNVFPSSTKTDLFPTFNTRTSIVSESGNSSESNKGSVNSTSSAVPVDLSTQVINSKTPAKDKERIPTSSETDVSSYSFTKQHSSAAIPSQIDLFDESFERTSNNGNDRFVKTPSANDNSKIGPPTNDLFSSRATTSKKPSLFDDDDNYDEYDSLFSSVKSLSKQPEERKSTTVIEEIIEPEKSSAPVKITSGKGKLPDKRKPIKTTASIFDEDEEDSDDIFGSSFDTKGKSKPDTKITGSGKQSNKISMFADGEDQDDFNKLFGKRNIEIDDERRNNRPAEQQTTKTRIVKLRGKTVDKNPLSSENLS